ncbi:hypothetical protein, partial [Pseudomonas aeruginosa]|uniref:hypothetical protein n=1 Tax=Pseudomonas aeruginosa TaxID=287 RepID=UPI001FF6B7DA
TGHSASSQSLKSIKNQPFPADLFHYPQNHAASPPLGGATGIEAAKLPGPADPPCARPSWVFPPTIFAST